MSGIRINLSEKEAASEARDFSPIPNGKYLVAVTEMELKECGEDSKNPGKPYYNMEFTVQEGDYADRTLFTNAMLFPGALYTIVQFLKSQGVQFNGTNFQVDGYEQNVIPDMEWFEGRTCVVTVYMTKGKLKAGEPKGGERYNDRPEIKNFWPPTTSVGNKPSGKVASGNASMLP